MSQGKSQKKPPWKPAGKPVKHFEYGYEAAWRPSRTVVPVKDIMEACVVTPADTQFRPSIKVINSGTGAWSEKWKASKRYIDPGRSEDFQWRSSVKTSHPHKVGHEVDYRPQVRPDPANPSLETNEGHFKPVRRHLLPYTPIKQAADYQQKRHIIVPSEWVPPFRIQGEDYNKAPPKLHTRGMVQEYAASHPPLCLAWDAPHQPGSVPSPIDRPGSPSVYTGHGATPYACAPNGQPRLARRYIPAGHSSHFEIKSVRLLNPATLYCWQLPLVKCCVCKDGAADLKRRSLRNHSASGPYHDTVPDRNPIAGHMPETDVFRPPRVPCGPALYGPAGTINSDIIGHKFSELQQLSVRNLPSGYGHTISELQQKATPVSEMKDRYRRWDIKMDK